MNKLDYIVVGLGIAGIAFCEQLFAHGKRFVVVDSGKGNATSIAAGTINPIVLKRFTGVWNVEHFLSSAKEFFKKIEKRTGIPFFWDAHFYRILHSVEEQNDWIMASDQKKLAPYLTPEILKNENPNLNVPYGFGKVNQGIRVNTTLLLDAYRSHLRENGTLFESQFEYNKLCSSKSGNSYQHFLAEKIVFAEGVGALKNPYFNSGMLLPRKGEYVTFKSPELQLDKIVKGPYFIIPEGNDLYKIGATLDRNDQTPQPTKKARLELEQALKKMIQCSYQVVGQSFGFRPTVRDRRPLLGRLNGLHQAFVFNGLGTRGILGASSLAQQLFNLIEEGTPLPKEIDIQRFTS